MSRAYDRLLEELFTPRPETVEEYKARKRQERWQIAGACLVGAVFLSLIACTCVGIYTVYTWMAV